MVDDKLNALTEEGLSLTTSSEEKDFYNLAYQLFSDGLERHIDGIFYLDKKGTRGRRCIVKPSPKLKKFHRSILRLLHNCGAYKFKNSVIGSVKFASRKTILTDHYRTICSQLVPEDCKDIVMIRMDIQDAFPSIMDYRVKSDLSEAFNLILTPCRQDKSNEFAGKQELFTGNSKREIKVRKCNYLYQLLDHLVGICVYKNRLPVGLPLSPALFNIALRTVDGRIEKALEHLGKTNKDLVNTRNLVCSRTSRVGLRRQAKMSSNYTMASGSYYRYVDDLIIFTHKVNLPIIKMVHRILQSEGLLLNPKKTKVIPFSSGWSALGLVLNSTEGKPAKRFMKKARGLWHLWKTKRNDVAYQKLKGMIASAEHHPFDRGRIAKKLGLRIVRRGPLRQKGEWDLIPLID